MSDDKKGSRGHKTKRISMNIRDDLSNDLRDLLDSQTTAKQLIESLNKSPKYENSLIRSGAADGLTGGLGSERRRKLEKEIQQLKDRIASQTNQVHELKEGSEDQRTQIQSLETDLSDLKSKERLRHLLDRVGAEAKESLLSSNQLIELFDQHEVCNAYVVSIDVRRSTDLMLKAREPKLFANFITDLAGKLRQIIIDRYGVFDKFTGDGVLAYFPSFYSGEDAGIFVADAAYECHKTFAKHYKEHRNCFLNVLNNVGLGIGLDFGEVTIVKMHGELTIVGSPVVYACRLGGANAGETLANQPAYEVLIEKFSEFIDFRETSIPFKHEGDVLAYALCRNNKSAKPMLPEWVEEHGKS